MIRLHHNQTKSAWMWRARGRGRAGGGFTGRSSSRILAELAFFLTILTVLLLLLRWRAPEAPDPALP